MVERDNAQWLSDLSQPGPNHDDALADLRALLLRGLGYTLASHSNVDRSTLEDLVQDALLKILAKLDTFRGESRFTTWAQKIAVNVAFSELRRRRWRDVSLDEMTEIANGDFVPDTLVDEGVGPEQQTVQRMVLRVLRRVIDNELTERQRQALVATRIHGVPLEEVARRMGTNRNALYKLLHDARQRLKKALVAEGMSAEEILAAFEK
ncbi:MAG: RNA polymerase sigma factor [Anaerolineae bacterium]